MVVLKKAKSRSKGQTESGPGPTGIRAMPRKPPLVVYARFGRDGCFLDRTASPLRLNFVPARPL